MVYENERYWSERTRLSTWPSNPIEVPGKSISRGRGGRSKAGSSIFTLLRFTLVPALFLGLSLPASAHVQLDSPNGGEMMMEGEMIEIRWHVAIEHNLQNWDLWYSTTGDEGPWNPIATDLPPGDPTEGAMHSHLWTVPGEDSSEVRVRVRQDNGGMDYFDISDADLTILPALPSDMIFADGFESGDTSAWTGSLP